MARTRITYARARIGLSRTDNCGYLNSLWDTWDVSRIVTAHTDKTALLREKHEN